MIVYFHQTDQVERIMNCHSGESDEEMVYKTVRGFTLVYSPFYLILSLIQEGHQAGHFGCTVSEL